MIEEEFGKKINLSKFSLDNNVWGATEKERNESLKAYVYYDNMKSYGWGWDRPFPIFRDKKTYVSPIFQCAMIGGNPWNKSNNLSFPILLKDIKNMDFSVDYTYTIDPSFEFNMMLNLWLIPIKELTTPPQIGVEFMVKLHQVPPEYFGIQQGKNIGETSDGNNTYTTYVIKKPERNFLIFNNTNEDINVFNTYKVNIKKLLDIDYVKLFDKYYHSHYLAGVEFGNEVWWGKGKINIQKMLLTMNNEEII